MKTNDFAVAETPCDALAFLQQVVGCNTVSPPGNEIALARIIEARLAESGIPARIFQENEHQANLVATLKGGAPGPECQIRPIAPR